MSLFAWAQHQWEEYPLVCAAMRYTDMERPAQPPALLDLNTRVWAGIDSRPGGGGSWLGLNEHGLVVAVVPRDCRHDHELRSRGLPCLEALERKDAFDAAESLVRLLSCWPTNPAWYVCLDPSSCWLVAHGDSTSRQLIKPGVHVMGSEGLDVDEPQRLAHAHKALQRLTEGRIEVPDDLARFCLQHATAQVRSGYGTRSASIILLHADGLSRSRYFYANGHPAAAPLGEIVLASAQPEPVPEAMDD